MRPPTPHSPARVLSPGLLAAGLALAGCGTGVVKSID